jgi:hypothetical protein
MYMNAADKSDSLLAGGDSSLLAEKSDSLLANKSGTVPGAETASIWRRHLQVSPALRMLHARGIHLHGEGGVQTAMKSGECNACEL